MRTINVKLLIIPLLLALTLFGIYHNNIEGETTLYHQPTIMTKMEQKILTEDAEIFTVKKELNSTKKVFTVETVSEINTTRDTELTLTAQVINVENKEACNFFWYQEGELVGIGSTLKQAYPKGEHSITIMAKDAQGHESNATVTVTAWDYKKTETLHFNASYGDLEYKELEIYDHKGRFLIMDDNSFSKYSYVYDEDDNRIERSVIYYQYPHENRKWLYTFDENHNQLTSKAINLQTGNTLYYNVKTYDEDGNITSSKSGSNEDELYDDHQVYGDPYTEEYYEYNSTEIAHKDDKTILDEHDNVIYEERNYDYMKVVEEYSYDENNHMTQHISSMLSEGSREDINIYNYDENQTITSNEQIYKINEEVICHFKTTSTYNEDGSNATEKKETLDGICTEYGETDSFKKFGYDKDGRVNNVVSSLEDESDDGQTTLKIIKSYTNDLEG